MTRRRKRKTTDVGKHWSDSQRIEAVTTWLAIGNLTLTGSTLGIPLDTLNRWKASDWWKKLVEEIRSEENLKTDAKLATIVDKALEATLDRVENGNLQFDQKRGKIIRVPMSGRDVAKVSTDMIDKRALLQNARQTPETTPKKIEEHLLKLALEFAKFAKQKTIEADKVDFTTSYKVIEQNV